MTHEMPNTTRSTPHPMGINPRSIEVRRDQRAVILRIPIDRKIQRDLSKHERGDVTRAIWGISPAAVSILIINKPLHPASNIFTGMGILRNGKHAYGGIHTRP